MRNKHMRHSAWGAVLVFAVAIHQSAAYAREDLLELSLEELMQIEIESISKKSERLRDAPAAAYVITNEDIRRSGARSLPEALRLAPGVEVAQINGGSWAVSIRGFNGRYANKLLVLLDGRSIYNPFSSGVYWENHPILIEDVERIEVVRGPSAAIWGPNAMNGVINVITRTATDAESGFVVIEGSGDGDWRAGGSVGHVVNDQLAVKATIVSQENSENRVARFEQRSGQSAEDVYTSTDISLRFDAAPTDRDDVTIIARLLEGERRELRVAAEEFFLPAPFDPDTATTSYASIQGHWSHQLADAIRIETFGAFEDGYRGEVGSIAKVQSVDVATELHWEIAPNRSFSSGLYFHRDDTHVRAGGPISYDPPGRIVDNYGGFLRAQWGLFDETLRLTAGSTFEENGYSGFEYQPTLRASWSVTDTQTLWAGVSRSVRTPSRIDNDVIFSAGGLPAQSPANPGALPVAFEIRGTEREVSESQYSYEAGYRLSPTDKSTLDIAAFYSRYSDLEYPSQSTPELGTFLGEPALIIPVSSFESVKAESYGVETSARWSPRENLRLDAAYTILSVEFEIPASVSSLNIDPSNSPEHMVSLQSYWNVTDAVQLDVRLRYASAIEADEADLPANFDLSGRLGWNPKDTLELSLIGEQLNDESRVQIVEQLGTTPATEVERRIFARVKVAL